VNKVMINVEGLPRDDWGPHGGKSLTYATEDELAVGDTVTILDGMWAGHTGQVVELGSTYTGRLCHVEKAAE
jgi:hypothetical protein